MTKRRFAIGLTCASILLASFAACAGRAQEPARAPLNAGKAIKTGDVLSGELNVLSVRDATNGKRVATYQIKLVTTNGAQAAQLKALAGKEIAVKVGEVACAEDAGQMSDAVITKWSLVKH